MMFKRKRQGKTDYRNRLKYLKSGVQRLIVRKSLKNIWAQVVEYNSKGDRIIMSAHTKELAKNYKWDAKANLPTAYLLGLLIGKKSKEKKIKKLILDVAFKKPVKGSKTYAFLKGAVDSGLNIPYSKEIFPSEDRISGKHIKNFNAELFKEVKKKLLT